MRVSVLIPVYNSAKYVRRAIESALEQKECGEIIIYDDGSTDNSYDICQHLAERDNRLRVIKGERNMGNYFGRNVLIAEATCPYISFLDSDDYFLPNRFQKALSILENCPEIDGVYEAHERVYEISESNSSELNECLTSLRDEIPPERLFSAQMRGYRSQCTGLPCFTVRRKVYEYIAPFDTDLRRGLDRKAVFQMAAVFQLVPGETERPVFVTRIHENNVTAFARTNFEEYKLNKLEVTRRFNNWARQNLSEQQLDDVDHYLVHEAMKTIGFPILFKLLPYRVFIAIRPLLQRICILVFFPHLLFSFKYWRMTDD